VQLRALRVPGQPLTGALAPFGPSAAIEAVIDAGSKPKERAMFDARTLQIRELNDAFRKSLAGGRSYCTDGVSAHSAAFAIAAMAAVRAFDTFTSDNDPYGEHDFGAFTVEGQNLLWKIDYYDLSAHFGSRDPADSAQTTRVLTIMLVEEY
jgi:hypothetical protein